MNYQIFKETVSIWENYEQKFKEFRIWAVNFYEKWLKDREIALIKEEQDFIDPKLFFGTEEYNDFMHEWNEVSFHAAADLYSKLGIAVGEDFKNHKVQSEEDGDFYCAGDFISLFGIVRNQKEDVKFCYGLLTLMSFISEEQKIYNYKKNVWRGLKEFGLEECINLISSGAKKVFIAMWFDEQMFTARIVIKRAVEKCGYEPVLIDDKEYNGQIVPEIFKEINDSEFVIADLTGQRGGVYYEAGYAMAKEKQVILCCKKGESSTHFDVAQINTIYWADEDDLHKRLIERIKATIGENL